MTATRRRPAVAAALGLAAALAACSGREPKAAPADAFAAVAAPLAAPDDPVIARVDGAPIHESEARARALQRGIAPGDAAKAAALVDDLAVEELLAAEARRQGLARDPAVRHEARRAMVQKLIEEEFDHQQSKQAIPEALLRRAYDANYWRYNRPELRGVQHFLARAKANEKPERHAAAQEVARDILALVLAKKPKSFLDVEAQVRERGKAAGIEVLFEELTESRQKLEKGFGDLLFSLREGEVGERIVKSRFGYHVLKCTTIAPAVTRRFEEVRDDVAKNFENQYRQLRFQRWLKELRQRYEVKLEGAVHVVFKEPAKGAGAASVRK